MYGAAIPAGVYVPIIMSGACFGSLIGLQLQNFFRENFPAEDCPPGTWCHGLDVTAAPYTLQGAVALLGGVQRSSLSLVVIILEGTGAVKQLLPIILTTVVAKWVGDWFNRGLYHTALQIKQIPFLAATERRHARGLCAKDVMTPMVLRGSSRDTMTPMGRGGGDGDGSGSHSSIGTRSSNATNTSRASVDRSFTSVKEDAAACFKGQQDNYGCV